MTPAPHLSEDQAVGVPLPPREFFDHNVQYGAPFVAAAYCGLPEVPPTGIEGSGSMGGTRQSTTYIRNWSSAPPGSVEITGRLGFSGSPAKIRPITFHHTATAELRQSDCQ